MMHPEIMAYWLTRVSIIRQDNSFGIVYWAAYNSAYVNNEPDYILAIFPHDISNPPVYYLGPHSPKLTEEKALRLIKLKAFL